MKHLKTFERYTNEEPINFENVFGFSRSDMADVLSELIDNYDFLDFDLVSNDYKNFKIEIFDENFKQDPTQDLKDEYKKFEEKIFQSLKTWLDSYNIKIEGHKLDTERNRIVVHCKQIVPVKEFYEFEDFTLNDMYDVKELYDDGLTDEEDISKETDLDLETVKQILYTLRKRGDIQ